MPFTYVFAGVPVSDYGVAAAWYERLFGREPDLIPNDTEAAWQVTDGGWVYIVAGKGSPGGSVLTLLVDDIEERVAALAERGIDVGPIDTIPGAVRTVVIEDPDGNSLQLGQPPA